MKKTCIIIAGGDVTEQIYLPEHAFVICADCGYLHALKQQIIPDLLVGDFDSYTDQLPEKTEIVRLPIEKDVSDTWYAVQWAMEHGFENFEIYGACGGERIDHTIANLQLMRFMAMKHLNAVLYAGIQILLTVTPEKSFCFQKEAYPHFSVFALSNICRGVTIKGAKYALENAELVSHFPLGLSNETEDQAEISVQEGNLLLILTK